MKVLLADDHHLVREGLKTVLYRLSADIEIIEAATVGEMIAALAPRPDLTLLILDPTMPAKNGTSSLDQIRIEHPAVPIVILSASTSPQPLTRGSPATFPNRCR